jgi:hypothetical protein
MACPTHPSTRTLRDEAAQRRLCQTLGALTMHLRHLVFVMAVVVPLCAAAAETFSLSANSGEFNPKVLGNPSHRGSLSATVELTKFAPSKGWPAAAYVGFFQGKNRDNSVQFLVIHNRETDPYVVAGYRVIEGGKEAKVVSLANLPLNTKAQVSISVDGGVVTLKFPPSAPVTFRTKLTEVSPYVSVSSGTAEFTVGP